MIDTSEQSVKMCYIACSDKKRNDGHCECHNKLLKQNFDIAKDWKSRTIAFDLMAVKPMTAPDPNVTLLSLIDCKTTKWFAWRPVKLNSGKWSWLKWVHRHEDIRPVTYQGLLPIVTYSEIPIIYDTDNHSSALH